MPNGAHPREARHQILSIVPHMYYVHIMNSNNVYLIHWNMIIKRSKDKNYQMCAA